MGIESREGQESGGFSTARSAYWGMREGLLGTGMTRDESYRPRQCVNRGSLDTPVALTVKRPMSLPSIFGLRHRDHEESIWAGQLLPT
jgi:hypothetical protein